MSKLFEPLQIGAYTVKNRIAFAPTGTGYVHPDGTVSDQNICHYVARAKGGAGWITIEHGLCTYTHMPSGTILAYHKESYTAGLGNLVEAIHAFGALAVVQLSLGLGRQTDTRRTGTELVSASPIPYRIKKGTAPRGLKHFEGKQGEVPRELSTEEVQELEKAFVECAERIKRVGFDGIEIHGAHGYLLASFLSPLTNHRKDEYGGSLENRLRLPLNLIRKTRQAVGKGFILGFRISGDEHVKGGLNLQNTVEIAKILSESGLGFIHLSSGIIESLKYMIPDKEGVMLPEAEEIKKAIRIPVICPNIHDPNEARRAVEQERIDMVSLSRPLLADPEWPNKVRDGRQDEIRKCIRCNQCMRRRWNGFAIRCAVNPSVGRERFIPEFWPPIQT